MAIIGFFTAFVLLIALSPFLGVDTRRPEIANNRGAFLR